MAVMSISQNILNKREIDNNLASFSTLTDLVFNKTFLELLNDLCGVSAPASSQK